MLDLDTECFVPRISKNLDVSSSRRLRIPYEELLNRSHTSCSFHGKTSAFQFLEKYLSLRTYEATDHFGMYFFQSSQMLSGVLIELRTEEEGRSPFELGETEAQHIGSFLVDSRQNLSRHRLREHFELSDIETELDTLISSAQRDKSKIHVFFLDLNPLVDLISSQYPFIEKFYLQKDIQGTLSLLSGEGGFCSTLGSKTTILALKSRGLKHSNVLIHQMRQLLDERFSTENFSLPELNFSTRSWPEDGENSKSLLSEE